MYQEVHFSVKRVDISHAVLVSLLCVSIITAHTDVGSIQRSFHRPKGPLQSHYSRSGSYWWDSYIWAPAKQHTGAAGYTHTIARRATYFGRLANVYAVVVPNMGAASYARSMIQRGYGRAQWIFIGGLTSACHIWKATNGMRAARSSAGAAVPIAAHHPAALASRQHRRPVIVC